MASRYDITLPGGKRFSLFYNPEQNKAALLEQLILKPWRNYCMRNWISENHTNAHAPEYAVKRLLDRCGTLLLRDVPQEERNTLTSYKEMIVGRREISVTNCPAGIADMFEGGEINPGMQSADDKLEYEMLTDRLALPESEKPARPRVETKFDRLQRLQTSHPQCVLSGERVDTDGCFTFMNRIYRIDPDYEKYAPRMTRYGAQYDMDRVLILHDTANVILFLAQDGYEIPEGIITQTEEQDNDR